MSDESPEKTPTRRVRFSKTNPCIEFERDDLDKGEKWVTKESCSRNKEKCAQLGRLFQRKGYDVLLNSTYYEPTCKDIHTKLASYVTLEEGDHCIRGIERFVSAKHADERRLTKVRAVESVVDLCTYMRRQKSDLEEIEEELRELSADHSRPARHFARRIAIADARAVQEEQLHMRDPVKEGDDETLSIVTDWSDESTMTTRSAKVKKGLSYHAMKGLKSSKRISRLLIRANISKR